MGTKHVVMQKQADAPDGTRWCTGHNDYIDIDLFYTRRGQAIGQCKACYYATRHALPVGSVDHVELSTIAQIQRKEPLEHVGPPYGSPERYFFCRLAVTPMSIENHGGRYVCV